jgi:NTP pyrophosphatase (non-canonical NTP hydrolase)
MTPREVVNRKIDAERYFQDARWGEQNHDDYRWLAILVEEVGELAQAMLHDEFGGSHAGTAPTELVQVAAVAVQWLECIERRNTP